MTAVIDALPRDRFLPLPQPRDAAGAPRRLGVEIEFGGLGVAEVAALLAERLGGQVRLVAPYEHRVEGTALGDVEVVLDTAMRKGKASALRARGLALGREVIPVEIVLPPLPPERFAEIDALRALLREAGALGSRHGILIGFGCHLNIEAAGPDSVPAVVRAFALVEDWLRYADPMDPARRLLPFVDPWPRRFARTLLAADPALALPELIDLYLRTTPTRNRALDCLPLFRHFHPERIEHAPLSMKISARPAYHYRLPDSRVDEACWTVAYEWNRWGLVEGVAADADLLATLTRDWLALDRSGRLTRHDWSDRTEVQLASLLSDERAA